MIALGGAVAAPGGASPSSRSIAAASASGAPGRTGRPRRRGARDRARPRFPSKRGRVSWSCGQGGPNGRIAPRARDGQDGAMAIIDVGPLDFQWQTPDPFLFCVHHDDAYPAGNDAARARPRRSPGATSARTSRARTAGACTTARSCPGFPQHPHRGFETVTIVRRGLHRSLRLARRDRALRPRRRAVADRRPRHRRTPRCSRCSNASAPNPLELFQIWLNLPARRQDGRRRTSRCCGTTTIPRHVVARRRRAAPTEVTVDRRARSATSRAPRAAAELVGRARRQPTSRSGRSGWRRARAGRCRRRAPGTNRTLYFFRGARLARRRPRDRRRRTRVELRADADGRARGRRRRGRAAAAAGPADRRAGRAVRPVRDEHARRDPAGVRRLPAHAVRRLAVAERRPGAPARRRAASRATPTAASSDKR